MRSADTDTESLFSIRRLDDFVPQNHPLRTVRVMVNQALKDIEPLLTSMYAADIKGGRPGIAPDHRSQRGAELLLSIGVTFNLIPTSAKWLCHNSDP
jgi:hypothetical protein